MLRHRNVLSFTHAYVGGGHNGGAETTLHDVMRMLRLAQYNATALVSKPHPDGSGSYVVDGVKVQAFASKKDPEYYIPDSDIVLTHLGEASRSGILGRKYGVPVVHLIHNDQPYCVVNAERYSDALVFNTEWVVDAYRNCLDLPYIILHPPVDPSRYSVETTRRYITIVNLTVGQTDRLSYDKGAHTFYEMARRFPKEEFLGVMGGYGDQYVPDDLPPNVTIVPHSNNILQYYRESKVILTPSKYESYGRVPLEAACSGIPSVITETPGTVEAMGYAARYCQFGNFDEWEYAIQEVLDNYDDYKFYAARRAAYCWGRTMKEWGQFQLTFESLIRR